MKMMRRSDVIRLVSGLLSRLKQNERCPRSHLHFLSSHTVETNNVPTCPTFGVKTFCFIRYFSRQRNSVDLQGRDTEAADYRPSSLHRFRLNTFPVLATTETRRVGFKPANAATSEWDRYVRTYLDKIFPRQCIHSSLLRLYRLTNTLLNNHDGARLASDSFGSITHTYTQSKTKHKHCWCLYDFTVTSN